MNDQTRESLQGLIHYWETMAPDSPFKEGAIDSCTKLLDVRCPLDDNRLREYFDRLGGPEGCNFRTVNGETTWDCLSGSDKSKSEAILQKMGLGPGDIALMHEIVDELGGHCDCEILWNAAERML